MAGEKNRRKKTLSSQRGEDETINWPLWLVGVVAVLVYVNALGNGLVYDDHFLIERNQQVLNFDLWGVFTTHYWGGYEGNETGQYRPLTVLSFVLDGWGGIAPFRFHLTNVLLHAFNSVLAYALCRQVGLTLFGGLVAGLLFAVHPIHAEAAAGVTFGRADLLAALGALATLWFYVRWHKLADNRFYGLALGAFFFGLISKESALTTVGLVVAFDLAFAGSLTDVLKKRVGRWAGFLGIFVLYLGMRYFAANLGFSAGSLSVLNNPLVEQPLTVRLYTAAALFWRYLVLIIWPATLSVDYSYQAIPVNGSPFDVSVVLGFLLGVGGLLGCGVAWRKWPMVFFFGALFFIPYAAISQTVVLINAMFQERFLYLPLLGVFALAGLGFERLLNHKRDLTFVLVGLLVFGYASRTWARNADWQHDLTLYQSAVRAYPQSAKMQHAFADALSEQGRFAEAEAAYRQALLIREDALTYNNLGNLYASMNRWAAAESAYDHALRLQPDDVGAWINRGFTSMRAEKPESAVVAFESAVALTPNDPEVYYHLGVACVAAGQLKQAATAYEHTVTLKPDWAEAYFNLGNVYRDLKNRDEAVQAYQQFLRMWRGDPQVATLARREIEQLVK